MEARDHGSRIRPLPLDNLDMDAPRQGPAGPKRWWVPLSVIAAGAIAFGIIATGLGAGGSTGTATGGVTTSTSITDTAAPDTTTPPAAAPATALPLGEQAPFTNETLRLIGLRPSSASVMNWGPEQSEPTTVSLLAQPQSASYNADGTRFLVVSAAAGSTLIVDGVDDHSPIHIRGAFSAAWHPTDPNLLAWTEPTGDEIVGTTVKVADLSGGPAPGVEPLTETILPGGLHRLRAWGDWGFATQGGDTTHGFDPDGLPVRSAGGAMFGSAPDGTLLVVEMGTDRGIPFLLNPDGTRTELPSLDIGASDYRIIAGGEWVVAITSQPDGHTSILARAVNSRSTRITSIEETARLVGTSSGDRFLVLQEEGTNGLIFKDWRNGAEYRIPVADAIGAVFLND